MFLRIRIVSESIRFHSLCTLLVDTFIPISLEGSCASTSESRRYYFSFLLHRAVIFLFHRLMLEVA